MLRNYLDLDYTPSEIEYEWSHSRFKLFPDRIQIKKNLLIINDMKEVDSGAYFCRIYKKNGDLITSVEYELQLSDMRIADSTPDVEIGFLANETIEIGSSFQLECIKKSMHC